MEDGDAKQGEGAGQGEAGGGALPEALRELIAREARSLCRFAAASVGASAEADALVCDTLVAEWKSASGDAERLGRAPLFAALRKRAAQHLERERRKAGEGGAQAAAPVLAAVRPTEREALLLRYVAGLPAADVAVASGTDETTARTRVSRALAQLVTADRGAPLGDAPADLAAMRRRVEERLSDVLDGLAPDDVADFVADDDVAKDLVYDAERKVETVRALASDHVVDLDAMTSAVARALAPKAAAEAVHEEPDAAPADVLAAEASPAPSRAGMKTEPVAAVREAAKAEAAKARAESRRASATGRLAIAAVCVGMVGAIAYAASRDGHAAHAEESWSGKVDGVALAFGGSGGLERCSPDRAVCAPVDKGDDVPAGSTLRTDGRTRAVLSLRDGTRISLDRDTELRLDGSDARRATLSHGSAVVEVLPAGARRARIDVPLGFVETGAAKLSLSSGARRVALEVVRGVVHLVDGSERGVSVHAGESGRIVPGSPPDVTSTATLGSSLRWSEQAFAQRDDAEPISGLGELRAKKPGDERERKGAVTLASHFAKVRIVGNVARTEIEEEFSNGADDVLEGIFRFPLPPDAQIERLALDVDGKMVDGAFVDRDRASAIWRGAIVNAGDTKKPGEEIVWVPGPWRDPALLEWQRGGRFELRIYPIPKHGSRKVILAYTQTIAPEGGERRYVYPLAHDPSGSTKVGRFDLDVQVRGHDDAAGIVTDGYPVHEEKIDGAEHLSFHAESFTPNGDLAVSYRLPGGAHEVTAWGYQPSSDEAVPDVGSTAAPGDAFVAIALRPKLPLLTDTERRSFAVIVDSSRSMFGERYHRASTLAARLLREMDPADTATVLACDSSCVELPGGPAEAGPALAEAATAFLGRITPEGGSDVSGAVKRAAESLRSAPRGSARIVYVGDGTPTIGAVQPAFIRREIEASVPRDLGSVTAVAIGGDADLGSLAAIADAGGGVLLPFAPGHSTEEAAYAVLGATYGSALTDVEIDVPDGLVDVLPRHLPTLAAGGEAIVTARTARATLDGEIRVRGKVSGAAFEQRYPLHVEATTAKGNGFVQRLWAAAKIAELEKEPSAERRSQAVTLSGRFHVASRYTSLLVLESSAMFQAFGLDRDQRAALWTGEDAATSTTADGELAMADSPANEPASEATKGKKESIGGGDKDDRQDLYGRDEVASSAGEGRASAAAPAAAAPVARSRKAPSDAYEAEEAPQKRYAPVPSPPPAPAPKPAAPSGGSLSMDYGGGGGALLPRPQPSTVPLQQVFPEIPRERPRRWIPMRKVWDRIGRIGTETVPPSVTPEALEKAARDADTDTRRDAVKRLYTLELLAGHLDRASEVAERWSRKDPLDPDALTARADVAAARGERDLAIRILGSVVDVRPGDHKAQWRLARLHRWAGRAELGCRHSLAVAQIRGNDAKLLAEAVRCARDVGRTDLASDLLAAADDPTRKGTEPLLAAPAADPSVLLGDLQVQATWNGGDDLDLAMLPPDGYRVSWLGAPTKAIITARDVQSTSHEGLGLNGAAPGDYVVEITRPAGHRGTIHGSIDVLAAGERRTVPFSLDGTSTRVALVKITTKSRLVPL